MEICNTVRSLVGYACKHHFLVLLSWTVATNLVIFKGTGISLCSSDIYIGQRFKDYPENLVPKFLG